MHSQPLLFGLYLHELERMLENASDIDAPCIADVLLAILPFAVDIIRFSYSPSGLQKQLDILERLLSCQRSEREHQEDQHLGL